MDNEFQGNVSYTESKPPEKGYAIASLVLGILGIVCCCCYEYAAMVLSVLAIVFFVVDKKKNGSSNGMAIAGLVCGIFSLLMSVMGIAIASTTFYKELLNSYESILNSMLSDLEVQ